MNKEDYISSPYPPPIGPEPFRFSRSPRVSRVFTDKYILMRAKELWPDLDIGRVSLIRAQRPIAEVLALHCPPDVPDHLVWIKVRPLMTTVGLKLSWIPEANAVVYYPGGAER